VSDQRLNRNSERVASLATGARRYCPWRGKQYGRAKGNDDMTRASVSAACGLFIGALVACGGNTTTGWDDGGSGGSSGSFFGEGGSSEGGRGFSSGAGEGSGSIGSSGLPASSGGTPGSCSNPCASDADCRTYCGAAPAGGANCCDLVAGKCYVSTTTACTAPPSSSGSGSGAPDLGGGGSGRSSSGRAGSGRGGSGVPSGGGDDGGRN
jgi:hypothetical protein